MTPTVVAHWMPRFEAYLSLLDKWNRTHALTALAPADRFEELVLDALALVPHLEALPKGSLLVDFGSGMGSPGLVLAMACEHLQVITVDAVSKKVAFMQQVIRELGLGNAEARQGRIEVLAPLDAAAGTAKAVGSLALLAGWWQRHGASGAPFYAFKSLEGRAEAIPGGWERNEWRYELPLRGQRCLVELKAPPKGR